MSVDEDKLGVVRHFNTFDGYTTLIAACSRTWTYQH